jgi:catechol 2,3-dioxygenase-like lactoylglutathione lyase family enzyme
MSDPLEIFRKQAKQLLRWHREGNYSVGDRIRRLERHRQLTDRQILDLDFTLGEAQELLAREQGCESWSELRAKLANHGGPPRPPAPNAVALLAQAIPGVFVSDVRRSARFFRDLLGFDIDFLHGEPPFYAGVTRDGASLHLRFVHEPAFAAGVVERESLLAAFITVRSVTALYAEYLERGVPLHARLQKEPWGGHGFTVRDPDGNRLYFCE